jgi:hypothetical protein
MSQGTKVRRRDVATRLGGGAVVAAIALAAMAGPASAKTISDSAYAAKVCGEVADVLEPLTALQAVPVTDLTAFQSQAVTLLDDAAEAAEDARTALDGIQPRSGGKKAAKTFDTFLRLRADAFADAGDQIALEDPADEDFADTVDAFVDVLAGAPLGLASPFRAGTVTKAKPLAKAFAAETTCEPALAAF